MKDGSDRVLTGSWRGNNQLQVNFLAQIRTRPVDQQVPI